MARFESSRPHAQGSICYFRQLEEIMKHLRIEIVCTLLAEIVTNNTVPGVVRHLQADI